LISILWVRWYFFIVRLPEYAAREGSSNHLRRNALYIPVRSLAQANRDCFGFRVGSQPIFTQFTPLP
jgi:hypothetical protein